MSGSPGRARPLAQEARVDRGTSRIVVALGAIVAAIAAVASAAGVLLRGDLATVEFRTMRGELVDVVTDGVYRWNAEGIVAEGIGWDLVTLLIIVPATAVTLRLLWRGSLRAALATGGFLAYFAYQYLQYATFWAYGPLFPLHVASFALAISALAIMVSGLDLRRLPDLVSGRFPHRVVTGYAGLVVLVLCGMWLPVIGSTLGGDTPDILAGSTTLVVQALDLGLLVPLGVLTAIAVHRRHPAGYVLGPVVLVKGASMALAISAMLLVEWQVTGELAVPPIVLFALLAVLSLLVGARALLAVREPGPPADDAASAARSMTGTAPG
jgi:hypothetical protein